MSSIYLGLVHYPVYNKDGKTITSGITNLDVHDLGRSALTYNIRKVYFVHPHERQKEIICKIIAFWQTEMAVFFNYHRVEALQLIDFSGSIDDTVKLIKNQEKNEPIVVTTTARLHQNRISFPQLRKLIRNGESPILLLFGTGNGLHASVHDQAHFILEPIQARADYNHLSVRSAVAIVLDRLFSYEYKE